jgi:hypothetical protein
MCLNIKIVIWKGTQRAILYYRKTAFLCYVLKATGRGVVCPCRAWLLRPLGYLHQGKGKNLQTLMFVNGRGRVIYVVDQWNRQIIEHSETVIVWEEQIFDQINNPSSIHFNRQQSEYCNINTTFSARDSSTGTSHYMNTGFIDNWIRGSSSNTFSTQ